MKNINTFILLFVVMLSSFVFAVDRQSTTTVTDPVGNVATQVFFGPYIYQTKIYKGSSTLLSTVSICYNGSAFPCGFSSVSQPLSQKDVFVSIPGISGPSQTKTTYNTYGLPLDVKAYDYGPTLVRDQLITYCTLGNATIRNVPCDIITKNSGGTTVADTVATYDSNGNLLTKQRLVSGSTYLTESFTYTAKGMSATSTGVNGATTTYTNSLCNGMEPSSISNALGTQTFTWNCNGAAPTSVTDINGKIYTVAYADPFWRPTSGIDSLGVLTTMKYTPTTEETVVDFGNSISDTLATFNTAGRPISSQIAQAKGSAQYDTVSFEYDSMGRQVRSSAPCIQSRSGVCPSAQVSTSYDSGTVLTTALTDALGGAVTTTYQAGDETTLLTPAPTGEAVKGKQLEYDGLGRITSVCEISNAAGSGSCGQRVPQTGFVTTYTYDAMGDVLTVTQGSQTRTTTYDDLGRILTSTQPETGTTTYTYDTTGSCGGITSNGDLVKLVDNAGNTICYTYDSFSRLTGIIHSGPNPTDDMFYVYDSATVDGHVMQNAKGRLVEAYTCTSCPGTKKTDIGFSYDAVGQTTDEYESTLNSGGYYHIALTVYPNQSVHTLQMTPSVIPIITYGLDGEGRTNTAQDGQNALVFNLTRGPANQVTSVTFGSLDSDVFGYDANTRMTQYAFQAGGNSVIGSINYNSNGTVSNRTTSDPFSIANNESCAYSYDSLLRLSTSNCGTVNQSYSYDRYGNISKSGTFSFTPTYNSTTNRMTAIGPVTPTYDGNGNLLTDGTSTYTWDAEGRMLSGPGIDSIIYNALGQMAEQTRGAVHQQLVYLPSGEKLALMNGQTLNLARVPLPGGSQAVYTSTGLAYYTHIDPLGSVRMTTTPARSIFSDLSYAPFGEPYNNTGVPTSVLSFTGHNQDTVSGLYDTLTREYNPLQGRWVSSDKSNIPSMGDPQTFNLYAYANNRPLNTTDANGAETCTDTGNDGIACVSTVITYPQEGNGDIGWSGGDAGPGGAGGSYVGGYYGSDTGVWTGGIIETGMVTLGNIADLASGVVASDPIGGVGAAAPLEEADDIIIRIGQSLDNYTGSGKFSLQNIIDTTYSVLDNYGSLSQPTSGPRAAFGLTNPGMTQAQVSEAVAAVGEENYVSGLNRFAKSVSAKPWTGFSIDESKGFRRGLFTLLDSIRDANGTIHFNLDGLQDIPNAVRNASKEGSWVASPTGGPRIKIPFNNGYTIAELRYLRDNWQSFNPVTMFYREGRMLQSGSPQAMSMFKGKPYEPWTPHWLK